MRSFHVQSTQRSQSVSQSAMSSLLYIFCIFCSVYFYQRRDSEKKLKILRTQLVSISVVILVSVRFYFSLLVLFFALFSFV